MNTTTRTERLVTACASVVLTFALFSTVASQAQPPVAGSLLAQSGATQRA